MNPKYLSIIKHYENCFDKYGDTYKGVDWPRPKDVTKRYSVMLGILRNNSKKTTVLDFGCGTARLYQYIKRKRLKNISYSGLDISEKYISYVRRKYPNVEFFCFDVLNSDVALPSYDYIILNGVFTEKLTLSYPEMLSYFKNMITKVFQFCNYGIAFNVMSKHVDWERKDLFHLPFDELASFLTEKVSRNFVIRNDYGLYEYTVYVYKKNK